MGQGDKVDHAVWDRGRGTGPRRRLSGLGRAMTGSSEGRLATGPSVPSRLYRSFRFWAACLWAFCTLGASVLAAETSARPMPREFDPFDILAWELLAGIDASGDALRRNDVREEDQVRIAIRPFSVGQAPLPASLANEYNDKVLVSLLSQGASRYRFIAREALGAVIKEIDESSAREAELDDLLAALVERAKADILVVGKLRRISEDTAVLSYEAIAVRDGTILAATSYQRLPLDPAEVDLAARSEALDESAKPAARPKSGDLLDFPAGEIQEIARSPAISWISPAGPAWTGRPSRPPRNRAWPSRTPRSQWCRPISRSWDTTLGPSTGSWVHGPKRRSGPISVIPVLRLTAGFRRR